MPNPISYLHPFKAGDLLTLLPGIKHVYDTTGSKGKIYQRIGMPAYFDGDDEQCMTLNTFNALKPLVEYQDYVESFDVWNGEKVDVDTTPSRDSRVVPLPNGSIHHWVWFIVPEMQCDLFIPWIDVEPQHSFEGCIVINRTARYRNPYVTYFFLKDYESKLVFVGTSDEHIAFCNEFKLKMPMLSGNFLTAARAIKDSKFFLGNQSACWHIADGMKHPRLLECSTTYPNTYPTGNNGYVFLHQKTLELQFRKLAEQ